MVSSLVSKDMSAPRAPSAHTEGPWNIRPERDYDRKHSRFVGANIGPDGESIRRDGDVLNGGVWIAEAKGPDCEANARLIAAAPDLLEVAKGFTIYLVEEDTRVHLRVGAITIETADQDSELGMALLHLEAAQRAAIAKAEGQVVGVAG